MDRYFIFVPQERKKDIVLYINMHLYCIMSSHKKKTPDLCLFMKAPAQINSQYEQDAVRLAQSYSLNSDIYRAIYKVHICECYL